MHIKIFFTYMAFLDMILKDLRRGLPSRKRPLDPKTKPRPRMRMQTARGLFEIRRYLWATKPLGGLAHPQAGERDFYRAG